MVDLRKKYNIHNYTIEYCPWCDTDQVIFANGVTACPNCGKSLAPCSMCEGCNYANCPYECDGSENDGNKPITNRPITEEERQLYKYL